MSALGVLSPGIELTLGGSQTESSICFKGSTLCRFAFSLRYWKPSGNVTGNSLLPRKAHYCRFAVTLLASVLALSLMAQAADSEIDRLIQVLDLKPGVA